MLIILLSLGHNALGDVLGNLDIAVRLHNVLTASLCLGAEVVGVTEHLGERNESGDLLRTEAGFLTLYLSAARCEIADDRTGVI